MIYTQLIITIFIVFALSRVVLRFKEGKISYYALVAWTFLWILAEFIIWKPDATTHIAKILGIGRGSDLILYGSIILLFYSIFRVYVKIEDLERQITQIARRIAIQNVFSPKKSKRKK